MRRMGVSHAVAQSQANAVCRYLHSEKFERSRAMDTPAEQRDRIAAVLLRASEEPDVGIEEEFPHDENAVTYDRIFELLVNCHSNMRRFVRDQRSLGIAPAVALGMLAEKMRNDIATAQADDQS